MNYNHQGLSAAEVQQAREAFGSNTLTEAKVEGFGEKLLQNFKDPIILILCFALLLILGLSFLGYTEWYEAVAIGFAVLLAVFVSTFSEYKNESSFQELQAEASKVHCKIFREGQLQELFIAEVVKGDVILLQAGDTVPADGKVIQGNIRVGQASLTGEAEPLPKSEAPQNYMPEEAEFTDVCSLFRGSVVEEGEAVLQVENVGEQTMYGKLNRELAVSDERLSPLQLKLKDLAKLISRFGYIGAGLIALSFSLKKIVLQNDLDPEKISLYLGQTELLLPDLLHAVVLAIIIIVAAVPEGLPMMIAIVLSLNMRKMLREKVLVRKLLGIETAGSLDLLFTDKTGTLTRGKLEAQHLILGNEATLKALESASPALREILQWTVLGNSFASVSPEGEVVGGNSSERAVIQFLPKAFRQLTAKAEVLHTIAFDSTRKFSATCLKRPKMEHAVLEGESLSLVKGATEIVLANCSHFVNKAGESTAFTEKQSLLQKADALADQGVRLLALAYTPKKLEGEELPKNMILVGLLAIRDETRPEAVSAVKEAQNADIQVVMITGDRKGTAKAIAQEVGLYAQGDVVLTSKELNALSDAEVAKLLPNLRVVARALPTDKSRLVRIAQAEGRVVGMTGDGVNDAAALKQADVGFAMGSGSEVAKEAGDIVILDDNFTSITNAVRYGRTIFKSIRKFIVFQLTVNLAAVGTAFLGPFFGVDFPLTILQILWINIIMDTLAAIALGGEPALHRFMQEKPVQRTAHILSSYMRVSVLVGGLYITLLATLFLTLPFFKTWFLENGTFSKTHFLAAFFNLFIFLIFFNAFNARTERLNLLENITKNKGFLQIMGLIALLQVAFTFFGGEILRTVPLTLQEWGFVLGLALTIIPLDLLKKKLWRGGY